MSSSPAQRSRSPVFWGAAEDAPLFCGPLGEAVGVVARGTVLLEASRHRDAFGGWWISTRCADGSLGWIEYSADETERDGSSASQPAAGGPSSVWCRVYDTRATPAPAAVTTAAAGSESADGASRARISDPSIPVLSSSGGSGFPDIDVAAIAAVEAAHLLFQDAALFQYYWECVSPTSDHRDWNGEYQRAVEECLLLPSLTEQKEAEAPSKSANECFSTLLQDFRGAAIDAVLRACAEAVVPVAQRRLPSLPTHPDAVFFVDGLLLKRCVDDADGDLGGDAGAAKLSSAIFHNCEVVARVCPLHFLSTPLMARCTFGGHTFLCSSIPPYGTANLIHACPLPSMKKNGSVETTKEGEGEKKGQVERDSCMAAAKTERDAHSNSPSAPPLIQDLLRGLADSLGLRHGAVPWEWRVYAGRDRRLYLAHTSRLLPPVLPLAQEAEKSRSGFARLYARFIQARVRPAVFFSWPVQWDVNECCALHAQKTQSTALEGESTTEESSPSSSLAVGEWMKVDGITRAAGVLGFQFPLSAPAMPAVVCNECGNDIDSDEIRFVVCAHPSQCCRICIQCYAHLVLQQQPAEDGDEVFEDEALSRTCATAVRCGGGCRKAGAFIMEPSVTVALHAHGVNVRYLPYVLHRLPQSTRPAVQHFLHVELVARAARYVLNEDLRRTTTAAEARAACESILSSLLQSSGASAERFWRTRLGPVLQAHFPGVCEPFRVSVHALRAVAERVQPLTGVWLSAASLASLDMLTVPTAASSPPRNTKATLLSGEEAKPFVEIAAIEPRAWGFQPPVAPAGKVGTVDGEKSGTNIGAAAGIAKMRSRLEALLLFWIGYAPEGADDSQQPRYLDESMFHF